MQPAYDKSAPKKPTNVTVNSDLLRQAKAYDINISATLEQALAERVKAAIRERWLQDNQAAIEAYNQQVEKHGVFSDGSRSF